MRKKIWLLIFSLMLFIVGGNTAGCKTIDEVKEYNKKALADYQFNFKVANFEESVKRNLKYMEENSLDTYSEDRIKKAFFSYLVSYELSNILDYDNVEAIEILCNYKGDTKHISNGTEVVDKPYCDIYLYYDWTSSGEEHATIYGDLTFVEGDSNIKKEASTIASSLQGDFNITDIDMINHLVNYKTDTTTFFSSKNATLEFANVKRVVEANDKFNIFFGFEETRRGLWLTGIANGIAYVKYGDVIYDFAFDTFLQSQYYFVPLGTSEEDYASVLLKRIKDYIKDDSIDISITEGSIKVGGSDNGNLEYKYADIYEVFKRSSNITIEEYYKMINSSFEKEYAKYKDGYSGSSNSYEDEYYSENKNIILAKLYTLKINDASYTIGILPMSSEEMDKSGLISSVDSKTGIILKTKSGNVPLDATLVANLYELNSEEINLLKENGFTNIDAYSLKLYSSILDKVISRFNDVTEVLIPYDKDTLDKELKMVYITDDNKIEVYDVEIVKYLGNNYLSFKTSHFSNYILVEDTTVNPNTLDNIITYIIILAIAIIGLVGIFIIKKKSMKK